MEILCIGIYRLKDAWHGNSRLIGPSNKRYVICNPSADFHLMPSDLVYVFEQVDHNKRTKEFKGVRGSLMRNGEIQESSRFTNKNTKRQKSE